MYLKGISIVFGNSVQLLWNVIVKCSVFSTNVEFISSDPHKRNYDAKHYPNENEIICFGRGCIDYGKKMNKFEYELIRDKHPIKQEILDEYKPKKEEIQEDPFTCPYCNRRIENSGAMGQHKKKCERIHTGVITEEKLMIEWIWKMHYGIWLIK